MYLFSALHGHGTSAWPRLERRADRVHARHELAVGAEHVERGLAHAGHVRMLTATYAESVSCTPMCAMGEPSGPIENGTTYIVRPRIAPVNELEHLGPHLAGSRQLLVGPASLLGRRADERAVLDPGDVARIGVRPVAVRPLRRAS